MKEHLKESRYKHSLGVQEMAEALSERYGVDIEKASFAGRYHDIAKCFEDELMDSYIEEFALDSKYLGNNNLAHSKVGAEILKHKFGVNDEDVLNAVRYHTTAKANMTKLEQIVFVADVVEKNRTYPDLKYYQDLAFSDIDRCTLEILEYIISDLAEKWRKADKDTLEAYRYYKERTESNRD